MRGEGGREFIDDAMGAGYFRYFLCTGGVLFHLEWSSLMSFYHVYDKKTYEHHHHHP